MLLYTHATKENSREIKKKLEKSMTRDQYTVVLEELRSQFKAFGEALGFVRDTVAKHSGEFKDVKSDLELLKGEVALIRHNQVSRDEFKLLESRVARLERMRKR